MEQQKIVISGGSRGLGAATTERLLKAGHSVATFSRRGSAQVERWQEDAELGERLYFQELDAANPDALREFVHAAHTRWGRIDALINNAAIASEGVLATADERSMQQMLEVNLAAAIRLTRECARLMLLREQGTIINIASVAAERGVAGLAVYSASKAGLVGFTRSLARELGPKGIRVNALAPGYLESEMSQSLSAAQRAAIVRRTPLGRLGTVDDIVPWIEFLLSENASFLTGQVITVDGGASV